MNCVRSTVLPTLVVIGALASPGNRGANLTVTFFERQLTGSFRPPESEP